jgi:hypothetical protein
LLAPDENDVDMKAGPVQLHILTTRWRVGWRVDRAQIQYLLACDNVKFVECDGVVHIAQKRGKDL